ncbi:sodium:proton antiporter [Vagococcus carniphilus]|uniref:cation:proton antiporter n=1 Tax=Vagococcus carniphilus TaxID=218144 RepID=UPI00288EBC89|nr:sodium:proton antiporter [Vagococcus carniphilus]MDT2814932.1 sodium:proton antiporter [Vagococcus carniphilus]
MALFETVLIMLAMVLLSNVLNRFIPTIAIPLIQVGLGMLLAIFTSIEFFEMSSEFFMLLFLAPLLFNDGVNVDKKALWEERKAITVLSIGLVFVTVGILGSVIHSILPSMPWAGSFALAAALAPTDAVAVSALAEKVKIPSKMMHTLEGESLINDASGLVSFQFAVAALLTGTFSIFKASSSFVLISLGGVLVGIVLTLVTMQVIRWLRKLGIENTISFILLELLMPFGIFLVAEHLEVNGILAVVSAGLVYSKSYQRVNPEVAQLHLISKNTWSVFTFSLNGLVFVLLGIQLPSVIQVIWESNVIKNSRLIFYILLITAILLGIRCLCFWLFRNFETKKEQTRKEQVVQSALYTISGVRGTITLVSALSLPILITGNQPFVEREILICLAGGVILTTLLLANFTMPLFAEKKEKDQKQGNSEQEMLILKSVIKHLEEEITPETQGDILRVVHMYNDRLMGLSQDQDYRDENLRLRELILKWQLLDTLKQLKNRKINLQVAFRHMRRLNKLLYRLTRNKYYRNNMFYGRLIRQKLRFNLLKPLSYAERKEQRLYLKNSNLAFVSKKLKELDTDEFSKELITVYLTRYAVRDTTGKRYQTNHTDEWLEYAIQLEREEIQQAFEVGDLNRNDVKIYRENLLAMESTIQFIN